MHLEKLEIQGFKSFAKRTVFDFQAKSSQDSKAKSITGIVGPNGSGKSNVADAIRWVLGEQSLKLIRCKKSDDVIFSGSRQKARQGFAEVELHMNNEDKELPIDYSEVVLTRRVYRDGETEYLLNKNKVRLYDILILLAKANFGQRSYSIVGQGMVDQIINISPWERKEFFDEATGVKQYQIKRDQSVNRLKRSRDNLNQTNKILAELEPRLRSLSRQVKKLEKRKTVEHDLIIQQKKYYGHIWQNLQRDKKQVGEKAEVKLALKQELDENLQSLQKKLAGLAREESRKEIFNELQKKYNKELNKKNDILKDLSELKGKMNLEYVKAGKQNLSWLENKKEELEKRISEIKESLSNLQNRTEHKKVEFQQNQVKFSEIISELEIMKNNLQAVEDDLTRIKSGRINPRAEAVKAVLRQSDFIKGIYGTVSQLGKVEPIYETALANAVGGRLSAVVVKDENTAIKCIEYLKKNKLSRVVFLPLNKIKGFKPKTEQKKLLENTGAIGTAINLIGFDPKYKKAFEFVFGGTIVVDNLENAKAIGVGKERMVTLDGDILEKSGAMQGGGKNFNSSWDLNFLKKQGFGSHEEKLKQKTLLKSKIEDFQKQKQILSEQLNDSRVELQVYETKQKGLNQDLQDLLKEKEKISSEIAENQLDPKDQDIFLRQLKDRRQKVQKELNEVEQEISKLRQKIDEFNLKEEQKKKQVFDLQNQMQDYQNKLNQVNTEYNEYKIDLARLETKEEELIKEVKQELDEQTELKNLKPEEEIINVDKLWFEISKLKKNLEQIGGIDPEIIDEHKEVSDRYEFLSKQVNDLEKAIEDLEKVVLELDELIEKQFNVYFKKINKAFERYFAKIFEGGKAKLHLIQKQEKKPDKQAEQTPEQMAEDQDDLPDKTKKRLVEEKSALVNTGIEIMVAPPHKKINNIAVLSGGERTMTSLALICAIIDSNPAPFVVMDEVEAALDDANSHKFGAILQELSYKTQFIIITHNRVTMHIADALYGVAMGEDGVSKTLSLDLQQAEKTVK